MINVGLRAHDFGEGTPEEIAKIIGAYNVTGIQLALAKSFPFIQEKPGQLSPGLANYVRDTFKKQGVNISVLGCYINPVHPDPTIKEQSILRFEEHLRFARDFGCAIVGTETGSKNADCTYHDETKTEETFLELVAVIKRLAVTAERYGSIVGIEGVAHHHTINTVEKMARMLTMVDSPNVQIIYDPVNFFPLDQCENQAQLMDQAFELFGDKIVAIHSKDFIISNGIKSGDLPTGTGIMAHEHLVKLIKQYKPYVQVILENTNPENANRVIDFLHAAGSSNH
ncbi:MAG: sugar phosphate isomerase/epimerase [Paraglaciecola sp.]|nr:sugar phosphate isomerase/epimerase [Paraglaciecola sp.]